MLVFYIFYLLVWTGKDPTDPNQSFLDIIENADAYSALLWGTMGAALTAVGFYFIQDYKDGRIIWFNVKGWISRSKKAVFNWCQVRKATAFRSSLQPTDNPGYQEDAQEQEARILMDYEEAMSSFILGMEKIFGALVVLTLAWASGAIMSAVGLNRLFGAIIVSTLIFMT